MASGAGRRKREFEQVDATNAVSPPLVPRSRATAQLIVSLGFYSALGEHMLNSTKIKDIFDRLRRRMDSLNRLMLSLESPPAGQHRDVISRICVEGRSVTNILQNLRHVVPHFDKWYKPFVDEMRNDELLRFFYKLRSDTLKKGDDTISSRSFMIDSRKHFMSISDEGITIQLRLPNGRYRQKFVPRPSNAISAFLCDENGGSGWVVKNADGSESKVYVEVPSEIVRASFKFDSPPRSHKGQVLTDTSANKLCELYVSYLREVVSAAEKHFGKYIKA